MPQVVLQNQHQFAAGDNISVLEAARHAGLILEHSCRSGRCGVCKAPVLSGETKVLQPEESLSAEEKAEGLILTCCRGAVSDLSLAIEDLGRLSGIQARTLPCRIAAIDKVAHDIVLVRLRLPPNVKLDYVAGQYIDLIAKGVRRSYSLANAARADATLDLHIRRVENGILSQYWFEEAAINDLLRFEGPLGSFFLRDSGPDHLVFLATGTGIAPILAILEDLSAMPVKPFASVSIYWGNRFKSDFYCAPTPEKLVCRTVQVLSGPEVDWDGARGHVQTSLIQDMPDLSNTVVYACGSEAMIHDAEACLGSHGLARRHFYFDAFVSSN